MPTDVINNNTVVDVNHNNAAFLINHAGIGNDLIDSVRINAPNRSGQIVRAVPIGSTRSSCVDPVVFAHVIEDDNDFNNLIANRRHIFRTTVINMDVNINQWVDTGLNFNQNDTYYITTTNFVDFTPNAGLVNANGSGAFICCEPLPGNHMALIGQFVDPANNAVLNGPFFCLASFRGIAPVNGRLQIRHNDTTVDNNGTFHSIIRSIDTAMPTNQFAFDFRPGQTTQKYQYDGANWVTVAGENLFTEFGANQYVYDQVSKTTYYTRDMNTLLRIGQQIDGLTNDYINVDLTLDNTTRFTLTSPNGNRWVLTTNTVRTSLNNADVRRGTNLLATPVNNTF